MKACIDQYGRLVIRAENSTENYALNIWLNKSTINVQDLLREEKQYIRKTKLKIE